MGTSRRSKLSEVRFLACACARTGLGAVTLVLSACGAGASGANVTAVSLPDAPRRPDGVVVETPPALPEATEQAQTAGVVALREPLADEAIVGVVRAMFRAFAHEDIEALGGLLTSDAEPLGARGHAHGALLDQWRTRLRNLPYDRLGNRDVARMEALERWSYADLDGSGGPVDRPSEMRPGDVLVRVPVATPRIDSEPLFGDVVLLLLRREGPTFKIAGESEDAGSSDRQR